MARKEKRRSLKKKTEGRQTPRDVRVKGTLAEEPKAPKKAPRKRTKAEKHADDYAPQEFAKTLTDMSRWRPVFDADLEAMNRGKVGRPYEYPDAMIFWIMTVMGAIGTGYGRATGFADGILNSVGLKAPSRSRLIERAIALASRLLDMDAQEACAEYGEGYLLVHVCSNIADRIRDVSLDSTGLNLSSVLGWRMNKWKTGPKDKGWLKLHALVDVDSGEVIAYALTTEAVGDAPLLRTLVGLAKGKGHRMRKVYADGAYSSDDNWIFLTRENGYEFVTSFKSNTAPTSNGCPARGRAAELWCTTPYARWTVLVGYGRRWKSECGFSDLKRMEGETVSAKTDAGAATEVFARIAAFNCYKLVRAGLMKVTGNGVVLV